MPENREKGIGVFREFRKTLFYRRWKLVCAAALTAELIHVCLGVHLWREGGGRAAAVWLLCLTAALAAIFWIVSWKLYIQPGTRIARIMKKRGVSSWEGSYTDCLERIFALLDGSIEREYSAKLLQKQTEFEALKNQINPHFLYNTLDTIRGYALMEEAPATSHMIEMLSRLFRYMIGQRNELITIGQEMDIIQDYIKIQEYRRNRQILLMQDIDEDLEEKGIMNYKIPKMSLEPFIENAIKHGMRNLSKEFMITVRISSTRTRLLIHITDNGQGMSTEELAALNRKFVSADMPVPNSGREEGKGTGIALTNVNARIKLLYGDEYGITVQSAQGFGTDFQITFPLKE